jgi:hypothetical protein
VQQVQDAMMKLEQQTELDKLQADDEAKMLTEVCNKVPHLEAEQQRQSQTNLQLTEKVNKLESELRDTTAEASKLAAILAKVKSENIRLETDVESFTAQLQKLKLEKGEMEKQWEADVQQLEQKLKVEKSEMEKQWKADVVRLEGKVVMMDGQRDKIFKAYVGIQKLASESVSKMKSVLTSESARLQDMCLQSGKDLESLRLEVISLQSQVEKKEKLIEEYERNLAQQNKNVQDKTQDLREKSVHLGGVLLQVDELRETNSKLEEAWKRANDRANAVDGKVNDLEKLHEEVINQNQALTNALDAENETLRALVTMLQEAGKRFFPDPFPERCQFKIPDRVWLITIEFSDNRKVLDDLLPQTYIEEDFRKGRENMAALPGGLTRSKVNAFGHMLKNKLENHASIKGGLDVSELQMVGKDIWLELNPKETDRADQQAATLATAMLEGVAPEHKFTFDMLQKWLDNITKPIDGDTVLIVDSRRDRVTLTATVEKYDRIALWVFFRSLLDYLIQSVGRQIANLSPEELTFLSLKTFLKQQKQQEQQGQIDTAQETDRESGNEYWNRDSDSTYSQSSIFDALRMSWEKIQTPRSYYSAPNGNPANLQKLTPRSQQLTPRPPTPRSTGGSFNGWQVNPVGGQKTSRSTGSHSSIVTGWFVGDHLFEA